MFLNIFLLPLLIIFLISFIGRYIGHKGVYSIIKIMMIELLIISIILNYEVILNNNIIEIDLAIKYGILNFNWYLLFDSITSMMLLMIISISLLVIIYTYDYMIDDPHMNRFYLYIIIFILNMIILITNHNLIILFIGWEGVGLSSFLLITFWFTRIETSLGGLIALFMNRVGDIFYILAILFSYIIFGSTDIIILNSYPIINTDIFIFFFFLAATAKSAQLYLHLWLPFSMEGPTPISALIHAATMVTAGVYILIRISILISYSYYSLLFISIIGALTAFIGSSLALTALDMKELIAYSTMSQLGYMVTCIGLKLNNLSYFHLIFHAYFKALLFLTAGSILHTILDIQDIRFTGGLSLFIPLSYIFLLIGLTSLMGMPFTTGYYSKESIIMMSFNNHFNSNSFLHLFLNEYIYIITLLTAFLTILYSLKLIYFLFFNTTKLSIFIFKHIHFFSLHLTLSLSFLSFITLIFGYIFNKYNILIELNIPFLNHNIDFIIKFIPILFFFFSYYILNTFFYSNISLLFLNLQFGFKYFYLFISGLFLHLSYRILFKLFDYGFIDLLLPKTGILLYNISSNISKYIYSEYILSFILFSLFILLSIL